MKIHHIEFAVEVWDRDAECWKAYSRGIHCARVANAVADDLMDRGRFARVVESH